jgi:hypothetical protein
MIIADVVNERAVFAEVQSRAFRHLLMGKASLTECPCRCLFVNERSSLIITNIGVHFQQNMRTALRSTNVYDLRLDNSRYCRGFHWFWARFDAYNPESMPNYPNVTLSIGFSA